MKVFKPDWVNHDDKPIFSIDVHPDGTRFATGGQGDDSGRVVIWSLAPLISDILRNDKTATRMLCQLDNHQACVNAVRWSNSGTTLASGGDDKLIMLWHLSRGTASTFGNSGSVTCSENWRCIASLRGHSSDILDLAWSPQDKWLASGSVDNNVIVWDMKKQEPSAVTVLKGHTGLVKGVTWDPVGKYLASQSDDRSIRIWRTTDWSCETTITEPFEDCGGTTHVLRLSWSPDGLYLVSAHAMNGGGATAQIIEREGWKCDKDFVGHRKAVTSVRFHQSILRRPTSHKNKYCCLAIGSRDQSISIWSTAMKRPLIVVYNLFKESVLDLSWSRDKHILLACSTDGTVAVLTFTEDELGSFLSQEEKNLLYQRTYGKSANVDMNSTPLDKALVEFPEFLDTKSVKFETSEMEHSVSKDSEMGSPPPPKIMAMSVISASPATQAKANQQQIVTRLPGGMKRITPRFIPLNQENFESTSGQELAGSLQDSLPAAVEIKMNVHMGQPLQKQATVVDAFRTEEISRPEAQANGGHIDSRLTKSVPSKADVGNVSETNDATAIAQPADDSIIRLSLSSAGKAIPIKNGSKTNGKYKVDFFNGNLNTAYGQLAKIVCSNNSLNIWETFTGSPIVSFNVCSKYVIIACLDSSLQILDIRSGIPILPNMKMFSPAIFCIFSVNAELAGVVTECGQIRVWNLVEKSIALSTNCHDLLSVSKGSTLFVTFFHVSESCVAYVLLSNGSSYSYSKKLDSWIILNSGDPIIRHGIASQPQNHAKNVKRYPLGSIQSAGSNILPPARNFVDITNGAWKSTIKLQFIENQIKICEEIKSPRELEYWYSMLGAHLSQYGTEKRVRVLLDDLLGSIFQRNRSTESILDIDKHRLLSNVLDKLKADQKWQRIYMEYSEQIRERGQTKISNGT